MNPRAPNTLRPHHPVVLPPRLHRADLRLGHLRAGRRPGESRRTARRSSATSTARPTASTSRRAAGCGSRPTCRAARSTPAPTPASATTRCCAPIRARARRAASSSARTSARSPACSSRPTRRTMFVGIQHPGRGAERRQRPGEPEAATAPGRTARAAGGRARRASSSPRTTAARSAAEVVRGVSAPGPPWPMIARTDDAAPPPVSHACYGSDAPTQPGCPVDAAPVVAAERAFAADGRATRLGRGVSRVCRAGRHHAQSGSRECARKPGEDPGRRRDDARLATGLRRHRALRGPGLHDRTVPDPRTRRRRRALLHGLATAAGRPVEVDFRRRHRRRRHRAGRG